jgi:hypothetical protein
MQNSVLPWWLAVHTLAAVGYTAYDTRCTLESTLLQTDHSNTVSHTAVQEHTFSDFESTPLRTIHFAIHMLLGYQRKKYRYANRTALPNTNRHVPITPFLFR